MQPKVVQWHSTESVLRVEVAIPLAQVSKHLVARHPDFFSRWGRQHMSNYLDSERIDVTAGNDRAEPSGLHERRTSARERIMHSKAH
jgi:hypothetical protein